MSFVASFLFKNLYYFLKTVYNYNFKEKLGVQ